MNGAVRKILLVVVGSVFLFSSIMVLKHHLETRAGTEYTESLIQAAVVPNAEHTQIKEVSTNAATSSDALPVQAADNADNESSQSMIPHPEEKTDAAPARTAPIQVDFDALRAQNQDIAAWIYCPDTPINYPVVQAADNDYYLHRLLNGKRNYAGTLFMDYRNAKDMSDWNCVIYGHNMKNNSMFGTLTNYKRQSYFESHREIFLLTPQGDYVINLVAGFVASADSEIYNNFCPDDEEKVRLLQKWLDASNFDAEYCPDAKDRLITLSTCSYEYDDARYVLVGVLEALGSPQL